MFTVGLTGGIGSGKSTFAILLAERGAQIIDADQLGRDSLRPGRPAWHSIVDTFGDEILVEGSMEIDRKALAAQVFADRNKLAVLNAITHPLIAEGIADALERLSHSDEIVVLDAALIVEMGLDRIVNALIVVDAPDEIRRRRLIARGMTLDDVERRMAVQAPRSELLDRADLVVHNAGTLADLAREADRVWADLKARAVSSIDIVFFDAGETLIHPHPSFPELFAQVCAENGIEVEAQLVAEVQGRLAPHLVDLAEDTGVTAPSLDPDDSRTFWTFLYRRLLEELDIDGPDLPTALYERFSDSASYKIFDDVLPTLSELESAGYRLGLVSNFEGWLENILVEQELGETFEVSVISGLEGVEKPDQRIYRLAVERAGVDPARCVHVGDSPVMDVRPAREVGINAILLDRTGRYMDSAYSTISSLKELPEVVTKL